MDLNSIEEGSKVKAAGIGFRCWVADMIPKRLNAVCVNTAWDNGTNRSYCHSGNYLAPGKDCHCGFNLFHSLPSDKSETVSGIVWGAACYQGDVQVHVHGVRSEKAEIIALLHNPNNDLNDEKILADSYDVPLFENKAKMLAALPKESLVEAPDTSAKVVGESVGWALITDETSEKESDQVQPAVQEPSFFVPYALLVLWWVIVIALVMGSLQMVTGF